uniref:C2H2-type domain-containing protein n=1 Tax=Poecilia formosa TaxID=48698 RepID=A0A096MFR5_POEFO
QEEHPCVRKLLLEPLQDSRSPLPPASLQLLVPPVRLMSAFVWKAVQQDSAVQYEKLLDFIDLATEIVPELLSPSQKGQLVLGLRARFVLELCRGNGVANIKTIQGHLDKIHTCCLELSTSEHMTSYSNFASLVQNILNVPLEKELFFQEVFPDHYGLAFNQRIQQLVSLLLSRLEQLLPIPDLQQFVSMKTWIKIQNLYGISTKMSPQTASLQYAAYTSTPRLWDFCNWTTSQLTKLSFLYVIENYNSLSFSKMTYMHKNKTENLSLPYTDGTVSTLTRSRTNDKHLLSLIKTILYEMQTFLDVNALDAQNSCMFIMEVMLKANKSWIRKRDFIVINLFKWKDLGHHLSEPFPLKTLLLHHRELGILSSGEIKDLLSTEEDVILSTLALSTQTDQFSEDDEEDDDKFDSDEETLALEDLEEDSNQSLDDTSEDWVPKNKSVICTKSPGTQPIQRTVRKNVQRQQQWTAPVQNPKAVKKVNKNQLKSQEMKSKSKKAEDNLKNQQRAKQKDSIDKKGEHDQKKDGAKNKSRRKRKEPTGEDKRFLSTRPVKKSLTEEELKCPTCQKRFIHPNQLTTHLKLHSFRYSCIDCEKGFTSQSGYYYHQRLHKRGREFTCKECNKGFLCQYSLKQHEHLHDGPPNFCDICERHFSKNGFVRHMQMHKGERNFLCTTCGKAFLSSGELRLHNRSHTGEMPYTCIHCGKGFSSKGHLVVHTRSHTGDRPYLCAECPKRFLTLNCLKRHSLSHNGVKPFKCPNCDREFSQQGNMKRHMATH